MAFRQKRQGLLRHLRCFAAGFAWVCAVFLAGAICGLPLPAGFSEAAWAKEKQAAIATLEKKQDLAVHFTFDKEVVDIMFLSPSGKQLTADSPKVEMASGELWSTYRISGAEKGEWSVKYDLKGNSGIEYSIIEDSYGVWLQYVKRSDASDGRMTVKFEADCEQDVTYDYKIYAVPSQDGEEPYLLSLGQATSGEKQETEVSLSDLSDGEYCISVEVSCDDGEAQLFDAMRSDTFSFINENTPEAMEDYCIYLNAGSLFCNVEWEDYAHYGDAYRLVVYGDGKEPLFNGTLEDGVYAQGFTFPEDAKKISISLSYRSGGIWSAPLTKEIELSGGEYLRLAAEDVTGSAQFTLEYSVQEVRELSVSVNEAEASLYRLTDTGSLSFDMEAGSNAVYAQFEGNGHVFYVVDQEIYYDAHPPEIILYDDLDGKSFANGKVDVVGRVQGADSLSANGKEVELDESGEFTVPFSLSAGENMLSLEAVDINGNLAMQALTLYGASKTAALPVFSGGFKSFLPLFAALAFSALAILLSFLFLKKKDKAKQKRKKGMAGWILLCVFVIFGDAFCIFEFVRHFVTARSLEFLETAERSAWDAAGYLKMRDAFGIASIAGVVLCILLIYGIKRMRRKLR